MTDPDAKDLAESLRRIEAMLTWLAHNELSKMWWNISVPFGQTYEEWESQTMAGILKETT